ncbi:MAG: hemerythrin domain-containing protein [Candidatus Binatia bacterium]
MQQTIEFSEIQRQHEELKKTISHLQDTAARASGSLSDERWRALLLEELALLRTSLVEHFGMEEDGGYLEAAVVAGQEHSVARLEHQHAEILDALDRIGDSCRGGALDRAIAGVRDLIGRLREHEAAECRLVQNAVIDDIGVGD